MSYRWFAYVAVATLSFPGLSWAQPSQDSQVDVAPLPAQDRDSMGAVVLGDAPVLAQVKAMRQLRRTGATEREAAGLRRRLLLERQRERRVIDPAQDNSWIRN